MVKYKNMAELAEAFRSGDLDRSKYVLMMDNDCSYLVYTGEDVEADERPEALYEGDGYGDIVDACNAAGIPTEWV